MFSCRKSELLKGSIPKAPSFVLHQANQSASMHELIKDCKVHAKNLQESLLLVQSLLATTERNIYEEEQKIISFNLLDIKIRSSRHLNINLLQAMIGEDYTNFQAFAREMDTHFDKIESSSASWIDQPSTSRKALHNPGIPSSKIESIKLFMSPFKMAQRNISFKRCDSSSISSSSAQKSIFSNPRSQPQILCDRSRKIFRISQQKIRNKLQKTFDKLFAQWKELKRSNVFRTKTRHFQVIAKRRVLLWRKPGEKQITFKLKTNDQLWERRFNDQQWANFFERMVNFIKEKKEERQFKSCNWLAIIDGKEFYLE